jgi:hypothetical protein
MATGRVIAKCGLRFSSPTSRRIRARFCATRLAVTRPAAGVPVYTQSAF